MRGNACVRFKTSNNKGTKSFRLVLVACILYLTRSFYILFTTSNVFSTLMNNIVNQPADENPMPSKIEILRYKYIFKYLQYVNSKLNIFVLNVHSLHYQCDDDVDAKFSTLTFACKQIVAWVLLIHSLSLPNFESLTFGIFVVVSCMLASISWVTFNSTLTFHNMIGK